jgi:Fur family transcriptional regulator, ferric uptake regulator
MSDVERAAPAGRVRQTRQAAAIEDVLHEADGFRTAQELHDQLRHRGDRVGLTTVYRHLNLLVEHHLADVVNRGDGESQYRLCGTARSAVEEHHHHIVCRECGRSVEVAGPEVERWAERVAAAAGYTDISHTVELFGLCAQHSA